MSPMQSISTNLPSARWTSFDAWDYNGMKERLQAALDRIDKSALLRHAEEITGQTVTMSEPFSAGQYWICFEMVAEDKSLAIARVRLPRHPDLDPVVTEEDEAYGIACEVATMELVRQKVSGIPIPRVFAYEGLGSQLAADVGAMYMLLEGFYGNTLQDVEFDICSLPVATQEHIMTQWTKVQAELAALAYPKIGSVCSISVSGEPVIGRLADCSATGPRDAGPFSRSIDYFTAVANNKALSSQSNRLGGLVLRDILDKSTLFRDEGTAERFTLNHMDLGTQNILVDDEFIFIAIIDWEFAQTAPWQINHYPMPFPLLGSDTEDILKDPSHLAYGNVLQQDASRRLYHEKFQEVESKLKEDGRPLKGSFADTLDSVASRIYACFTNLGRLEEADGGLIREMVRLAFGLEGEKVTSYLAGLKEAVSMDGEVWTFAEPAR